MSPRMRVPVLEDLATELAKGECSRVLLTPTLHSIIRN